MLHTCHKVHYEFYSISICCGAPSSGFKSSSSISPAMAEASTVLVTHSLSGSSFKSSRKRPANIPPMKATGSYNNQNLTFRRKMNLLSLNEAIFTGKSFYCLYDIFFFCKWKRVLFNQQNQSIISVYKFEDTHDHNTTHCIPSNMVSWRRANKLLFVWLGRLSLRANGQSYVLRTL